MPWYIKSERDGLFIGECLGLGFFQASIKVGDCSPEEEPVEFDSKEEAQSCLDSWIGGPSDCSVVFLEKKEVVREHAKICTGKYKEECN